MSEEGDIRLVSQTDKLVFYKSSGAVTSADMMSACKAAVEIDDKFLDASVSVSRASARNTESIVIEYSWKESNQKEPHECPVMRSDKS